MTQDIETLRDNWIRASDRVSKVENEHFQSGSGYGDPDAIVQAHHDIQVAREHAQRNFIIYQDASRAEHEKKLLSLQQSTKTLAWFTFLTAVVSAFATLYPILSKK